MNFKYKQNILIGGFSIAATNCFALAPEVMNQNLLNNSNVCSRSLSCVLKCAHEFVNIMCQFQLVRQFTTKVAISLIRIGGIEI